MRIQSSLTLTNLPLVLNRGLTCPSAEQEMWRAGSLGITRVQRKEAVGRGFSGLATPRDLGEGLGEAGKLGFAGGQAL